MEQVNAVLGVIFIQQTFSYGTKSTTLILLFVAPYARMIYLCYIKDRSLKESLLDVSGYTYYFDEESVKKGIGEKSYALSVYSKSV